MSSLAEQQATYYVDPDTGHLMMPGTRRYIFLIFNSYPTPSYRKQTEFGQGYVTEFGLPIWKAEADKELTLIDFSCC